MEELRQQVKWELIRTLIWVAVSVTLATGVGLLAFG
jgi:hypothetical protein